MRPQHIDATRRRGHASRALLLVVGLVLTGCLTDVPPSPDPGVLRVTLQADPADSTLEMLGRTVASGPGDTFVLNVSNGAAYRDSTFALLLPNLEAYLPASRTVNILARSAGQTPVFRIFETLVPPAVYDSLAIAVQGEGVEIGGLEIPVSLPEGEDELLYLRHDFEVTEGDTTIISLVIRPLASVVRVRDQFIFRRQVEVAHVAQR